MAEQMDLVLESLGRIESALTQLLGQKTAKEWYTTDEVAAILGKAEFTVREWCRNSRVRGAKKGSGRGKYQAWVISHAELQRIQREGLLPPKH